MEARDKVPATHHLEGSVTDWTSESYVNLEGFASSRADSICCSEMTAAQRNAVRLRSCANPADLTKLLSDVWKPNPDKPEPFSVDSGEGIVHDLDVAELLFFSRSVCEKLISFIGFHQTNSDAKNAAMDVFTWFCTQSALLKSMFVSSEVICNWALSLAIDQDPSAAVAGLRGLVSLIQHETYRKTLHKTERLIGVLDQIDLDTKEGQRAATLAFMSFHTIILSQGTLQKHDDLVKKLEELAFDARLASAEEQYWRLNCFQAAVILSEHRVKLMNSFASKLHAQEIHEQVEDLLLKASVNLYLSLAAKHEALGENLLMDCRLGSQRLIAELFKTLSLETDRRVSILKLLIVMARDSPCLIFENLLHNLPILMELMEGSPAETSLILDLFTATSQAPEPKEKQSLHQAHGFQLVKLLLKHIDEQKLQVLSFIWTHYKDTKQVFIEANVVSSMLSLYLKPQNNVSKEASSKVKKILCTLLEDSGKDANEIQDKVMAGLKAVLTSCDIDSVECNLRLVLGILKESTAGGCASRVMHWLVEEGLTAIYSAISNLHKREAVPNPLTYVDFYTTVEKLIAPSNESRTDRKFFLNKFVMLVKAVDIWPTLSLPIQNHNWNQEFVSACGVENLSFPSDVRFGSESLRALGAMIKANQQDFSGFLHFLLKALLEIGLDKATGLEVRSSGISRVLAKLLYHRMVPTEGSASSVFMYCVAAVIKEDKSTFADNVRRGGSQGYANLWNLLIKNGSDVCSDDEARAALLSFLRQSPRG